MLSGIRTTTETHRNPPACDWIQPLRVPEASLEHAVPSIVVCLSLPITLHDRQRCVRPVRPMGHPRTMKNTPLECHFCLSYIFRCAEPQFTPTLPSCNRPTSLRNTAMVLMISLGEPAPLLQPLKSPEGGGGGGMTAKSAALLMIFAAGTVVPLNPNVLLEPPPIPL